VLLEEGGEGLPSLVSPIAVGKGAAAVAGGPYRVRGEAAIAGVLRRPALEATPPRGQTELEVALPPPLVASLGRLGLDAAPTSSPDASLCKHRT
jgi:hypothetical protein